MEMNNRSRAQAAIYDGILLLLLAALSSTVILTYVGGTYGSNEDQVLRSAYTLNYIQSAMKSMYHIDAGTLGKITAENVGSYDGSFQPLGAVDSGDPDYWNSLEDQETGCPSLEKYRGSISVTDLLKRDLGEEVPVLNDRYGQAIMPGRTAMRCAMKELMKPFAYAGYRYYVEARDPQTDPESNIPVQGAQITNSRDQNVLGPALGGCDAAQQHSRQLLSVSSPFRALYTSTAGDSYTSDIKDYKIRVCVWPAANASA